LYVGLMITPDGPSVIEYNARFGDPECQVIMPLLDGDWGIVCSEVAQGRMPKLKWKSESACCVVMAAEGYPDTPVKGVPIEGLTKTAAAEDGASAKSYVLHAGTTLNAAGEWVTNGGRVLNILGLGSDIRAAIKTAYAKAETIHFKGMQFRRDIGAKLL
ncbi:MAG TPA: phosphoribosylglycinamide synthetase C domain-containing protein, partial [Bdellovibrionales bacterium]|nr:phosphoribosylglycinamide synthetase C domain-containing protein [Bdellovibrionales bacterium]